MIIPKKDIRVASYKATQFDKKVYVLTTSSIKNSLKDVSTHLVSHRVLLSTCAEKEYTLAFDMDQSKLNNFRKHYNIYQTSIGDVLDYCKGNKVSLLVMNNNLWTKYDPGSDIVSVHNVQIKFLDGVDII